MVRADGQQQVYFPLHGLGVRGSQDSLLPYLMLPGASALPSGLGIPTWDPLLHTQAVRFTSLREDDWCSLVIIS